MLCSDNSRCNKFNLIEVNGIFICKNCNAIFNRSLRKVVIRCCKKRFINRRSNIAYCKNCKKFVCI